MGFFRAPIKTNSANRIDIVLPRPLLATKSFYLSIQDLR